MLDIHKMYSLIEPLLIRIQAMVHLIDSVKLV